ncbi:MAG: hypothetical protein IPK79_03625 [Vampirovibrionales bacterium]|nr:hypothetical protein [Vampirovibrionales bacterium]
MYRKLLPLLNRFVMLRQGPLGQCYVGRLLSVEPESVEIETYHPDGSRAACWVILLATVTEFLSDSKQLDTLALRVKWANSPELAEPAADAPVEPMASTPLPE